MLVTTCKFYKFPPYEMNPEGINLEISSQCSKSMLGVVVKIFQERGWGCVIFPNVPPLSILEVKEMTHKELYSEKDWLNLSCD